MSDTERPARASWGVGVSVASALATAVFTGWIACSAWRALQHYRRPAWITITKAVPRVEAKQGVLVLMGTDAIMKNSGGNPVYDVEVHQAILVGEMKEVVPQSPWRSRTMVIAPGVEQNNTLDLKSEKPGQLEKLGRETPCWLVIEIFYRLKKGEGKYQYYKDCRKLAFHGPEGARATFFIEGSAYNEVDEPRADPVAACNPP